MFMKSIRSKLVLTLTSSVQAPGLMRTRRAGILVLAALLASLMIGIAPTHLLRAANSQALWTTEAPMPTARAESAFGVINGRLYVAGGEVNAQPLATVEVYDPSTNTWATKNSMPFALYGAASAVINGKLYVAGGAIPNTILNTLEAYDPTTDTWTSLASMPIPEANDAADTINGKLYVVGGINQIVPNNPRNAILQVYDPSSNTWAIKSPMPTARAAAEAVAINGLLYVVEGTTNSAAAETGVLEVYDPATDTWTSRTPMPTPRDSFAAAFVGGHLYAIGGNLNGGPQSTANESYDPTSDTWVSVAPMPTARGEMANGVIGGTIFVVGGAAGSGFGVPQNVNEAFTPSVAVGASLVVNPTSGPPGTKVTITGTGLPSGEVVSWAIGTPTPVSGTAVANPGGVFNVHTTIPSGTPPASYQVSAVETSSDATLLTSFTVT